MKNWAILGKNHFNLNNIIYYKYHEKAAKLRIYSIDSAYPTTIEDPNKEYYDKLNNITRCDRLINEGE